MDTQSVRFRAGLIVLVLAVGGALYMYFSSEKAEQQAQVREQQVASFYEQVQTSQGHGERLLQQWQGLSDEQVRASLLTAANEMRAASLAVKQGEPSLQPVAALFDLYARVAEEWGKDFAGGRLTREELHSNMTHVVADLERISRGPVEAEAFATHWQKVVQELQTEEVERLYRAQGY